MWATITGCQNSSPAWIADPLEQFESFSLVLGLPEATNITYFVILVCFVWLGLVAYTPVFGMMTPLARLFEAAYSAIIDLSQSLPNSHRRHFPLLFYFFLFILISNLIGILPYTFTITSCAFTGLFFSGTAFLGVVFLSLVDHGFFFFRKFVPAGTPIRMLKFLVVIELISYFIRVLSLAIRLVANMISGHILLKILMGFVWTMLLAGGVLSSIGPWLVILAVLGLEVLVAVLQAYVFTFLVCIYLGESASSAAH